MNKPPQSTPLPPLRDYGRGGYYVIRGRGGARAGVGAALRRAHREEYDENKWEGQKRRR